MALPTIAAVQADITAIYAVLADRKTRIKGRLGVQVLSELISPLNDAFVPDVTFTPGTDVDANIGALLAITGELGLALGRAAVEGDVFAVTGTGDTTDNALAGLGGGGDGDFYQVAAGDVTALYLGAVATIIETDSESVADFAIKAGN